MSALRRLSYFIPGDPIGKGRPKFSSRGGRPRAYTPAKTVAGENAIAKAANDVLDGLPPLAGVLAATVTILVAPPASASKRARADMLAGVTFPTKVPDVDNVVKLHLDGCNKVAFLDDKQVVDLAATKRYGPVAGVFVDLVEIAA